MNWKEEKEYNFGKRRDWNGIESSSNFCITGKKSCQSIFGYGDDIILKIK